MSPGLGNLKHKPNNHYNKQLNHNPQLARHTTQQTKKEKYFWEAFRNFGTLDMLSKRVPVHGTLPTADGRWAKEELKRIYKQPGLFNTVVQVFKLPVGKEEATVLMGSASSQIDVFVLNAKGKLQGHSQQGPREDPHLVPLPPEASRR